MEHRLINGDAGTGPGAVDAVETEDLDVTLVAWPTGREISAHTNHEVDVVSIVLAGVGEATVDGIPCKLVAGSIIVIPKGAERTVRSLSDDFRYVNIHKRKRKLMPRI